MHDYFYLVDWILFVSREVDKNTDSERRVALFGTANDRQRLQFPALVLFYNYILVLLVRSMLVVLL